MYKYPYNLITGDGLGFCYSSLNRVGPINMSRRFGQGAIQIYANAGNGNVTVVDRLFQAKEKSDLITLGYVYNAQKEKTPWHFTLESLANPNKNTVTLTEKDGHETTYTYQGNNTYIAPPNGNGQPQLTYASTNKQWHWFNPLTGQLAIYNSHGQLIEKSDEKGRSSHYYYDSKGRLDHIEVPASGNRYQLSYTENAVHISMTETGKKAQLIQSHTFDTQGRLTKTEIHGKASSYSIYYNYLENTTFLKEITQDDQTQFEFDYTSAPPHDAKINTLSFGKAIDPNSRSTTRIDYSDHQKTTVTDAAKQTITIHHDPKKTHRLDSVEKENGIPGQKTTTTVMKCEYNTLNQLTEVTQAEGGTTNYQYTLFGLQARVQKQPMNKTTNYYYDQKTAALITRTQLYQPIDKMLPEFFVTRYVYDNDFDHRGLGHRVLRFVISPTGSVTEHRYTGAGDLTTTRTYIAKPYDTSQLKPTETPSLKNMETWANQQDSQAITLTAYGINERGLVSSENHFAQVDKKGQGISDAGMSTTTHHWNYFGKWTDQLIWIKNDVSSPIIQSTHRQYDALHRVTENIDNQTDKVYKRTQQFTYEDKQQQQTTIQYNGRKDTEEWNTQGLPRKRMQQDPKDASKTRTTTFQRDIIGRKIKTTTPDGQIHYQFYDYQNRLAFTVTNEGIVTEYVHDTAHRTELTIVYYNAVDIKKLDVYGLLPGIPQLLNILKPLKDKDRYDYTFYDKNGQKRFHVDAERGMVEYRYDNLGRKTETIRYKTPVTEEQLNTLKKGTLLTLTPDAKIDRIHRFFWDSNNQLIGEQNAAGYVTQYRHDIAGRTIETIYYAIPIPINLKIGWNALPLQPNKKDIHQYGYWNARNQCIATINGEHYLTAYEHDAFGNTVKETRYANPVTPSSTPIPPTPKPDPEDHVTTYQYDLLNRRTTTHLPSQTQQTTAYDTMDNAIESRTIDALDLQQWRGTNTRYNLWNEKEAECNPFVAQILANSHDKEAVWKNQSTRYHRNASGLTCYVTNALGYKTYYFYDHDGRLRYQVNPRGSVSETVYDTANQITQTRRYVTLLPDSQRTQLKGGFLTSTVQQWFDDLKKKTKDAIVTDVRDRLGHIIQSTDPEGYVTKQHWNTFGECDEEKHPVAEKEPTKTITHEFEPRGLETKTTIRAPSLKKPIIETTEYKNPLGKPTKHTNPLGGQTQFEYDKVGQCSQKTTPQDGVITKKHDAFKRIASETTALRGVVKHTYQHKERRHQIIKKDKANTKEKPLTKTVVIANAFAQPAIVADANGNAATTQYAPDGQMQSTQNPLGHTTKQKYDLLGNRTQYLTPEKIPTNYTHDPANNINAKTLDPKGLNQTTRMTYDALNRKSTMTDPKNSETHFQYDRRSLPTTVIRDAQENGLQLSDEKEYNGSQRVITHQRGNHTNPNQLETEFQYDPIGRQIGDIVDPKNKKITTKQTYNAANLPVLLVDANGNKTWQCYDKAQQLRFTVDQSGIVKETRYDKAGHPTQQRLYAIRLTTSEIQKIEADPSLSRITDLMKNKESPQDTVHYLYYDEIGRLRFTVDNLGRVQENRYDQNSRKIMTVRYADTIPLNRLPNRTDQLSHLMARNTSPKDRITYYCYDVAGQERFTIDPENVVTEKIYDACGRIICQTIYANPVQDPKKIATLPTDQIASHLKKDPLQDRVTYHVFNADNKPFFNVDPEGNVIRFDHDANGNLTQMCSFVEPIRSYKNYNQLVNALKKLKPNPQTNRIIHYQYDAANRKITAIDALGFKDQYRYDALNNLIKHIDRVNALWEKHYDSANRLIKKIAPSITVTVVTQNTPAQLTSEKISTTLQTQYTLDNVGNQTAITLALGTPEERTVHFEFNTQNKPTSTTLEKIAIDDPNKLPSFAFNAPPTKTVDLSSRLVYDTKNNIIVEKNEADNYRFYVYDAANQKRFTVDENGAVQEWEYNAFGEVSKTIRYANPLTLDFSQYVQSGLTETVILKALQKDPVNDRETTTDYNKHGYPMSVKQKAVYYYQPNTQLDQARYLKGQPETQYHYNSFGDQISEFKLIDDMVQQWARTWRWLDRNSKLIAEVNPNKGLTRYTRNAFGEEEQRIDYATELNLTITEKTTVADLDVAVKKSPEDRELVSQYDQRGDLIKKTKKAVVTQSVTYDKSNKPSLHDNPPKDLSQQFLYTPKQQLAGTTYEDGSSEYQYCNAAGHLIAKTGVPRDGLDEKGDPATLVPLTEYGVNCHGQCSATRQYATGTSTPQLNVLPKPLATSPNDQTTLILRDKRGITTRHQDPENTVIGYTTTATKKPARQWSYLTNSDAVFIDEMRLQYDKVNNPIQSQHRRYLQGNPIQQSATASRFNVFREEIAEGPGDGTWPVQKKIDTSGHVWFNNESQGVNTLLLYNLAGAVTGQLKSASTLPDHDLAKVKQTDIPTILSQWGAEQCERTDIFRDAMSHWIAQSLPAYETKDPSSPLNMPLVVTTGKAFPQIGTISLSWKPTTQTTLVALEVVLSPRGNSNLHHKLPVQHLSNRSGVDVSSLPTDVYHYVINFFPIDPVLNKPMEIPEYRSEGLLQLDTAHNEASESLVVIPQPDGNTLRLTGNTEHLTAIQLKQNNQPVGNPIPVTLNQKKEANITITHVPSGPYQIQPINGDPTVPLTLPFTVYTNIPSPTPLGREIECQDVTLQIDGQSGTLQWQVSEAFSQNSIQIVCDYTDDQDATRQLTSKMTPPQQQITFQYPVKAVNKLQLSIEIGNQIVPLLNQMPALKKSGHIIAFNKKNSLEEDWVDFTGVSYTFGPTTTLWITPLDNITKNDSFQYYDTSLDLHAAWKTLPFQVIPNVSKGAIAIDITPLSLGIYPYTIGNHKDLSFTYANGSEVFNSTPIAPPEPYQVRPFYQRQLDRWNNVIEETNSLGDTTTHTYNRANKRLSTTTPPVTVVDEKGQAKTQSLTTRQGYNARNFHIAEQKPKGNVTAWNYNAAGQPNKTIQGDGTVSKISFYNALSQEVRWADSRLNKFWNNTFSRRNQVVKITPPSHNETHYAYNENKDRRSETDPFNKTTHYDHDMYGHVSDTTLPGGQKTHTTFDRHGEPLEKNDGEGSMTWKRDYWSHPLQHVDFGGANYHYKYDQKYQSTQQTSQGGEHGNGLDFQPFDGGFNYKAYTKPVPPQHLEKIYQVGRLQQVIDHANQKVSTFDYNTNAQRIRATLHFKGSLIADNQSVLDPLGRPIWLKDRNAFFVFGYDKNSNKRYLLGAIQQRAGRQNQFNWYTYDDADRALIDGGELIDGTIQITPNKGIKLAYGPQNDFRTQETNFHRNHIIISNLTYTDDGLLEQLENINHTINYKYDKANRPLDYLRSYQPTNIKNTYNENGWITSTYQNQKKTEEIKTSFIEHSPTGDIRKLINEISPVNSDEITDHLSITYVGFDARLPSETVGYRHYKGKDGPYSGVIRYHDANAPLQGVQDGTITQSTDPHARHYPGSALMIEDAEGHVLLKWELAAFDFKGDVGSVDFHFELRRHAYVHRYFYDYHSGALLGSLNENYTDWLSGSNTESLKLNFDQPLPATASFPPPAPEHYVVFEGDTFTTISEKTKGTPTYAAQIAHANGWPVDATLRPGTTLTIPATPLLSTNQAHQHPLYREFLQQIVGSIYPNLITPIPHPHRSFFESLIEIVVAVVILVYAPELFSALHIPQLLAVALASAVADAADQGIEIAYGSRKSFSLKELASTFIEAGIQAGFPVAKNATWTETLLHEGEIAVAEQALELSLGLRSHFDLKAAIIQTTVRSMGDQMHVAQDLRYPDQASFVGTTAKLAFLDTFQSLLQSALYQQPIDLNHIAAQILGDALYVELNQQQHQRYSSTQKAHIVYHQNQHAAHPNALPAPATTHTPYRPQHTLPPSKGNSSANDPSWQPQAHQSLDVTDTNTTSNANSNLLWQYYQHTHPTLGTFTPQEQPFLQNAHAAQQATLNGNGPTPTTTRQQTLTDEFGHLAYVATAYLANGLTTVANHLNLWTEDLLYDVAGSYGTDYFNTLHASSDYALRFSRGLKALAADIEFNALADITAETIPIAIGITQTATSTLPKLLQPALKQFGFFKGTESLPNLSAAEREFYSKAQLISEHDFYHPGTVPARFNDTFLASRYKTYQLTDDFIFYRGGSSEQGFGQFLSFDKPLSELQVRMDKAIRPLWPDGGSSVVDAGYAIRIPKGATVHIGDVASQNGIFLGGTKQVFVDRPWLIPGAEIVDSYALKEELLWNQIAMKK